MKLAVLIVAHHQPDQLAQLIRALACDWIHIFVHIDKKSNVQDFLKCTQSDRNVTFLSDVSRVKVNWGGFSQVRAILNLLREATSSSEHFDRYCLLSGVDYPIKPLALMKQDLESDKEFISIDRRLTGKGVNAHCRFVRKYHFYDYPLFHRLQLSGIMNRRKFPGHNLYHGCSWWCLTHNCVEHILHFIDANHDYCNYFKYVMSSDEIFFHSIVKHSPYTANISHDFERGLSQGKQYEFGIHYIDWHAEGVSLPKVLDLVDQERLRVSSALFARKFDGRVSRELIKRLREQNLGG